MNDNPTEDRSPAGLWKWATTRPQAYVVYVLALILVWGARWIAGPLLSGWRVFPIAAVLVGILCFGEFPDMVTSGFASEIFGLALVAGLIAVIARGPGTLKEQVVLLSLLLQHGAAPADLARSLGHLEGTAPASILGALVQTITH